MSLQLQCVALSAGAKGRGIFARHDALVAQTRQVDKDFFMKNANHSCDPNVKIVVNKKTVRKIFSRFQLLVYFFPKFFGFKIVVSAILIFFQADTRRDPRLKSYVLFLLETKL